MVGIDAKAYEFQPLDGDLSSIANIQDRNGLLRKLAPNVWQLDTNILSSASTNGLATTNYVNTATNGFVTASITNGFIDASVVTSATNNALATATNSFDATGAASNIFSVTTNWNNFSSNYSLTIGYGLYSPCVADINGDGQADVLFGGLMYDYISVITNKFNTNFVSSQSVDLTPDQPSMVLAGNIAGRGRNDAVWVGLDGGTGYGKWGTVTNNGSSLVNANLYTIYNNNEAISACLLDVFTSGRTDVAIAWQWPVPGYIQLWTNNGVGGFASYTNIPMGGAGYTPECICSADFDGNGQTDLASANQDLNTITVGTNSSGFFKWNGFACATVKWIAPGNFKGYGKPDIFALYGNNPYYLGAFTNAGDGVNFSLATNVVTAIANPGSLSVVSNLVAVSDASTKTTKVYLLGSNYISLSATVLSDTGPSSTIGNINGRLGIVIATGGASSRATIATNYPTFTTNGLAWQDITNYMGAVVNGATNNFWLTTSNMVQSGTNNAILIATNLAWVTASNKIQTATNNLAIPTTNQFVTVTITNGLASTNYVLTTATNVAAALTNQLAIPTTNQFVIATITNGLASTNFVNTTVQAATNGLTGGGVTLGGVTNVVVAFTNNLATTNYVNVATNGFVTASITNGLATTNYVNTATNNLGNSVAVAMTNAANQITGNFIGTFGTLVSSSSVVANTNTIAVGGIYGHIYLRDLYTNAFNGSYVSSGAYENTYWLTNINGMFTCIQAGAVTATNSFSYVSTNWVAGNWYPNIFSAGTPLTTNAYTYYSTLTTNITTVGNGIGITNIPTSGVSNFLGAVTNVAASLTNGFIGLLQATNVAGSLTNGFITLLQATNVAGSLTNGFTTLSAASNSFASKLNMIYVAGNYTNQPSETLLIFTNNTTGVTTTNSLPALSTAQICEYIFVHKNTNTVWLTTTNSEQIGYNGDTNMMLGSHGTALFPIVANGHWIRRDF